jgi:hypothetical protein
VKPLTIALTGAGAACCAQRRRISKAASVRTCICVLASVASLVLLAGCGPVRLVATTNIPTPLVVKIPIGVALFIPKEFAQYAHEEERWSTKWHVDLGKAQTDGITRLMNAIFERVVMVENLNAGAQLGSQIRAILEPSIEEYAFVTPRDAGSPFFAVSIKYRVNVYMPDGKLADSWGFTGYGTSPSEGLSSATPLAAATALAMRDAGAKLAVEFREQAIVRGLLPEQESADSAPKPAAEPAAPETPSTPQSGAPVVPAPSNAAENPPIAPKPPEEPESEKSDDDPAGDDEKPAPVPEPEAFAQSMS